MVGETKAMHQIKFVEVESPFSVMGREHHRHRGVGGPQVDADSNPVQILVCIFSHIIVQTFTPCPAADAVMAMGAMASTIITAAMTGATNVMTRALK